MQELSYEAVGLGGTIKKLEFLHLISVELGIASWIKNKEELVQEQGSETELEQLGRYKQGR